MKNLLAFFSLLIVVQTVGAQDLSERQDTVLMDEVTIVSRKEGRKLEVLPISGSEMNTRLLRSASITNIKDFSLAIPNMFMPDYGTKLNSPVFIRGIGSKINSPSVGLYVDGIPYFEKSAFDFEFADISSIEVLRGPQGTMFGRNAMGGIINVTTKSPLTYKGTTISLSGGSKGRAQASISDYRKFTDNFGYGISGFYQHNDGFFYNETLSEYADKLNSGGGRLKLSYKKDRHELNFVTNVEYSEQSGYPYMLLNTETLETTDVNYNRESLYNRFLNSNGLSYTYSSPKIILTSRTSHQYSRDHQGIDQDFTASDLYYVTQKEKQNMFTQEVEVRQVGKHRISWIAGASGFYQSLDKNVAMEYVTSGLTTDKYYDTPIWGAAFYGQATLDRLFVDNLSFTFGLRYDFEKAKMDYENYYIISDSSSLNDSFDSELNHSQLSPKFSLQYQIEDYGQLYATVTKGYKAGGFNSSFIEDQERSFKPEYSWSYELGTKFNLCNNKLKGSFAVFYIDWKDQQVYQLLSTGTGSLLKNAAESTSYGVEASLNYQPIERLNFGVDYGYTNAKFDEYVSSAGADYSSNRLSLVPQSTISGRADYTFVSFNSCLYDRINVAVQYNGVGDIYWNDANTAKEDYYNLLNARVSISKSIITFAVWAKNITNTKYNAYYLESLGNSYIQQGKPFTIGADLILQF
ncbi:MAG: TonB-dependent receptor [Rikenellaceae bacterium]